ncbi:hypothetical protein C485_04275 [Natrinema altunense JCM 12890]|uniref:SMI1/KNR4 family protein n=2 Tax=Natrinema altunense TaxID=222984 RepID=L9ZWY8_NATA2|nr:hypothetical protein C485_04275 [Natrinema altunense JCM 12890]
MKRQQEFAEMEIKEGEVDFEFDTNDFVFMGHQGYSFYFFNTEEGDDPPVYVFMSHGEVEQKADSFSEWLFEEIKRHGRIRND